MKTPCFLFEWRSLPHWTTSSAICHPADWFGTGFINVCMVHTKHMTYRRVRFWGLSIFSHLPIRKWFFAHVIVNFKSNSQVVIKCTHSVLIQGVQQKFAKSFFKKMLLQRCFIGSGIWILIVNVVGTNKALAYCKGHTSVPVFLFFSPCLCKCYANLWIQEVKYFSLRVI